MAEAEPPEPFGFKVVHDRGDPSSPGDYPIPEGWRVYLPHQCDSWDIVGSTSDAVPHAEAVAELEAFIAEAQTALTRLRAQQFDLEDHDWVDA